jgi:restriction endonuclease S subunit
VSTGTTPSTKNAEYWSGSVPFVKTAEIDNNVIRSSAASVSDAAVKDYHLKVYAPRTVFLAMYGQGKTRGRVALLDIAATTSQNTGAIVTSRDLDPKFLWFYLLTQYEALRATGAHAQISHLNLSYVKELLVPIPPPQEQRDIVQILDAIDVKLMAERTRSRALDQAFASLVVELMTGRWRVTAAEVA